MIIRFSDKRVSTKMENGGGMTKFLRIWGHKVYEL